jgi:formylmethanofuran dehydrogenase subunit D
LDIVGTPTSFPNNTIALTASATNYLEYDRTTGDVSVNQSSFTGGLSPLYEIVCGSSTVTSWLDKRALPQGTKGENGLDGASAAAKLYYFQDLASDISATGGYYKLLDAPLDGSESDDSVSVTSGGGPVLIEGYASEPANPGITLIPAGLWTFNIWAYVNSITGGNSSLVFHVYKRILAGTETEIFNVESAALPTAVGYQQVRHTMLTDTVVNTTDRIVIKVYAKTLSASSKTVHFVHDGVTHNSQVQTPITQGHLAQPYDIGATYNGAPQASTVLLRIPFVRAVTFPIGLSGSQGVLGTAATAQTNFDILKNGVSFGTMRFAISGTVASFISTNGATFAAGDVLTVISPASPDATAAHVGFCLTGIR